MFAQKRRKYTSNRLILLANIGGDPMDRLDSFVEAIHLCQQKVDRNRQFEESLRFLEALPLHLKKATQRW